MLTQVVAKSELISKLYGPGPVQQRKKINNNNTQNKTTHE